MPSARLEQILRELRYGLERIYGSRLVNVILFGSQARGEAEADSDIDVLVVLQGPVDPNAEISRVSPFKVSLCLKYDVVISCVYVSEAEFRQDESPLLLNIRREGVPVWLPRKRACWRRPGAVSALLSYCWPMAEMLRIGRTNSVPQDQADGAQGSESPSDVSSLFATGPHPWAHRCSGNNWANDCNKTRFACRTVVKRRPQTTVGPESNAVQRPRPVR